MQNFTTSAGFGSSKPSRRFTVAALPLAAVLLLGAAGANAAPPQLSSEGPWASGQIMVKARAGIPNVALERIARENGAIGVERIGQSELRLVKVPPGLEKKMVERLSRNPHIEFAELDEAMPLNATNDPYLGSQWHLPQTGVTNVWPVTTGNGLTIAIIDTGVDGAHPDLKDRMVAGYNFYDSNTNSSDVYGHGTAVAGTAAATLNNGVGVASPSGGSQIMPLRISAPDGTAYASTMAKAITWAADKGAKVANLSYQSACGSSSVQTAGKYMKDKGGLVVVSAGNTGVQQSFTASDSLVCVSATDKYDKRTSWSSYGGYVDVAAPGAGIYTTTRGGGYGSWNGTSFSAPLTAGILAQIMAVNPNLSPSDVERLLYTTAVDRGAPGYDVEYGWGRVDAYAAVQAALNAAPTSSGDTQAPKVAIAAPTGASTVTGLTTVDVSASDNVGVGKVEFWVNSTLVATDTSAPFAFSWDSTRVANGSASLAARAFDTAGNAATSATVTVNVANTTTTITGDTTPPSTGITSPADGAVVPAGSVSVTAGASDNAGLAGLAMTLAINGKQVSSSSGTGKISYKWNTRKIQSGVYTLTVTARDASGNTSSHAIRVSR